MRTLLVSANRETLPSPVVPLGVLAVAGALRTRHEVRVVDLCFEAAPLEALGRAIEDFRPEVVGVGLRNLHTNAYDGTERLIAEYAAVTGAVRAATRAPIVLGGAGFSLRPTALLEELGADHGVVGEGEWAMAELVDALATGGRPPALVRATAARSQPVSLGRRGGARKAGELDALPPIAKDLVDPRYYAQDGTDNVQTKRGCAFACAYCDYPDLEGHKVRVRAPERVADEVLGRAGVAGVDHIFFVDSVFNVPRSHAIAVSEALAERGAPLPWVCYASPASLDEEVVRAMARGGCKGAELGSDAGTAAQLTRLKKPFEIDDIRRSRQLFLDHGIHDCHTFVLGAMDETVDEVKATLDFVDALDPDLAVFIVFMEDREEHRIHRARHRDAILALLAAEAPRHPGWVVPELSIRFGAKLTRVMARGKLRGPSWLHLAQMRRRDRARELDAGAPAPG